MVIPLAHLPLLSLPSYTSCLLSPPSPSLAPPPLFPLPSPASFSLPTRSSSVPPFLPFRLFVYLLETLETLQTNVENVEKIYKNANNSGTPNLSLLCSSSLHHSYRSSMFQAASACGFLER